MFNYSKSVAGNWYILIYNLFLPWPSTLALVLDTKIVFKHTFPFYDGSGTLEIGLYICGLNSRVLLYSWIPKNKPSLDWLSLWEPQGSCNRKNFVLSFNPTTPRIISYYWKIVVLTLITTTHDGQCLLSAHALRTSEMKAWFQDVLDTYSRQ